MKIGSREVTLGKSYITVNKMGGRSSSLKEAIEIMHELWKEKQSEESLPIVTAQVLGLKHKPDLLK